LPEPQRKKVIYALQQRIAVHQGPIPHPDILAGYQSIDPEFAHKIVEMAEKEQQHRHNQDRKTLEANIKLARKDSTTDRVQIILGQILGFVVAIAALGGGVMMVTSGHPITGGIFGVSGIAGVVSVFVVDRRRKQKISETSEDSQLSEEK
jgi:uncharacterized membrane protein